MSNNTKSKFTLAFKQDAVKLVIEKGYTYQQAADSLGISLSAISRWVRAEKDDTSSSASKPVNLTLAERDELLRLRKQCANLLMEKEILKKTAVFFAKESE